nr:DUF285 domain-containing protein [Treponema sp.]
MKKVFYFFIILFVFCFVSCKDSPVDHNGTIIPEKPSFPKYEMKTGLEINEVFEQMGAKTCATSFKASPVEPSDDVTLYYLDKNEKDVPVWYDEYYRTIYFYADIFTVEGEDNKLALNEDSSKMFYYCDKLTNIDLTKLDSTNVTDMSYMFAGCSQLTTFTVKVLNTENVKNMSYLFAWCTALESVDFLGASTLNLEDMSYMFYDCNKLTTVMVSTFNSGTSIKTPNVKNMNSMFSWCTSLKGIDLSSFRTPNLEDVGSLFYNCYNLTSCNISYINTKKVKDMSKMFLNCKGLKILNLTNFNTANVE